PRSAFRGDLYPLRPAYYNGRLVGCPFDLAPLTTGERHETDPDSPPAAGSGSADLRRNLCVHVRGEVEQGDSPGEEASGGQGPAGPAIRVPDLPLRRRRQRHALADRHGVRQTGVARLLVRQPQRRGAPRRPGEEEL